MLDVTQYLYDRCLARQTKILWFMHGDYAYTPAMKCGLRHGSKSQLYPFHFSTGIASNVGDVVAIESFRQLCIRYIEDDTGRWSW